MDKFKRSFEIKIQKIVNAEDSEAGLVNKLEHNI